MLVPRNIVIALLLVVGAAGCSSTDDSAAVVEQSSGDSSGDSSIASDYFGSVSIAQGSSIDTAIDNVSSSSDIKVVDAPDGVTVTITDGDDGATHVELKIADDAPVGAHAVTFDIAGEAEPVNWTIEILAR